MGFVLLVTVFAFAQSGSTKASGTHDVTVDNTAANPVPTAAQGITSVTGAVAASQSGTWSVDIANSPTVQAAQSGLWNVSVSGAVGLTAGTTVGLTAGSSLTLDPKFTVPVASKIGPTGTDALLVRNANDAQQPYQMVLANNLLATGNFSGTNLFEFVWTVPTGKRFVIEQVSVYGALDSNLDIAVLNLLVEPSTGQAQVYRFPVTHTPHAFTNVVNGTQENVDGFAANAATKIYADPGAAVVVDGTTSLLQVPAYATVGATLSGYLVDVP
jgi:hypothetical protein